MSGLTLERASSRQYHQPFDHIEGVNQLGQLGVQLMCPKVNGIEYGLRFTRGKDEEVSVAIIKHSCVSRFSRVNFFKVEGLNPEILDTVSYNMGSGFAPANGEVWRVDDSRAQSLVGAISSPLVFGIVENALKKMRPGADGKLSPPPNALISLLLTLDVHGDIDGKKFALLSQVMSVRDRHGYGVNRILACVQDAVRMYIGVPRSLRKQVLLSGGADSFGAAKGYGSYPYYQAFMMTLVGEFEFSFEEYPRVDALLSGLKSLSLCSFKPRQDMELQVSVPLSRLMSEYSSMSGVEQRVVTTYLELIAINKRINDAVGLEEVPCFEDIILRGRYTSTLIRYLVSSGGLCGSAKVSRLFDRLITIGSACCGLPVRT